MVLLIRGIATPSVGFIIFAIRPGFGCDNAANVNLDPDAAVKRGAPQWAPIERVVYDTFRSRQRTPGRAATCNLTGPCTFRPAPKRSSPPDQKSLTHFVIR